MILYEYPFNERIRTLLHLEGLFEWLGFFLVQEYPLQHHVALTTLFGVVDVAGRADLKSDLLKELDRQHRTLTALHANPQIGQNALDAVISEPETASGNPTATHGKAGQLIVDNEWLTSIRSHAIIPGGTCEFDLSAHFAWQHRPAEHRRTDIIKQAQPLVSPHDTTMTVLRLLCESGQSGKVITNAGNYQQILSGRVYQLMQMRLDESALGFIPKISADKHMLWVRFIQQDGDLRPKPVGASIPFQLKLCNF